MAVVKMSVSLDEALNGAVREAAELSGETLSGWLADAAQAKLRSRALEEFLDVWESENRAFTEAEIEEAAARLGLEEATKSSWSNLFKLIAAEGSHDQLVLTITRLIEGGHPVLVSERDVTDVSKLMKPGERFSFEKADIRVRMANQ